LVIGRGLLVVVTGVLESRLVPGRGEGVLELFTIVVRRLLESSVTVSLGFDELTFIGDQSRFQYSCNYYQ